MQPRLTDQAQKDVEVSFANDREARELLALIDAEFRSDPASVQCFDLRLVMRVRECVAKHRELRRRMGSLLG